MSKFEDTRRSIDEVSPSFCLAKWYQVTLDLVHGLNHSCHHPDRHKIELDELSNNPSALHNTKYKKQVRSEMLSGIRPSECEYCWNIEDTPGEHVSDRVIKSSDDWAFPQLEQTRKMDSSENVDPTYLEVMFSKVCNLACAYCRPDISSSIEAEVKKFGALPLKDSYYRMPEFEKSYPSNEEENPYLKSFWEWFPRLSQSLEVLRITGGEPLLSDDTFKVLNFLSQNPNPRLKLAVNSNLSLPKSLIDKFVENVIELKQKKAIQSIDFYVSIDSIGKQAEYIRSGLNEELFWKNLVNICERIPESEVIVMCTYSVLSISSFDKLLKKISSLKENYKIKLDIAYLKEPQYLRSSMATDELILKMEKDLALMDSLGTFSEYEMGKYKRIYYWVKNSASKNSNVKTQQLSDFYVFIDEFDKRKNTEFLRVFPDLKGLVNIAKKNHFLNKLGQNENCHG